MILLLQVNLLQPTKLPGLTHHKLTFQSQTVTYYNTYAVENTIFCGRFHRHKELCANTLAAFRVSKTNSGVFWGVGGRWRAMQHFGRKSHDTRELNSVYCNRSYQLISSCVRHSELEHVGTLRSNN